MLGLICVCGTKIAFPKPEFGTTAEILCPCCLREYFILAD
jgi:hypothetical protein